MKINQIARDNIARNALMKRLEAEPQKKRVHIVGCGPSATEFRRIQDDDYIICINDSTELRVGPAMQRLGDLANMRVMVEESVWDFEWSKIPFYGLTVLARGCADTAPADKFPESWWKQVCWAMRTQYKGQSLRHVNMDDGLILWAWYGGSFMHAIHISQILCASALHFWGAEHYFAGGQQRFDGTSPHTWDGPTGHENSKQLAVCRFRMDGDDPVFDTAGPYYSTSYYVNSALGIREVCKRAEIEYIDHSRGLLSPKEMPR